MSMEYCHAHNRHFDTDYDLECPECEQECDEIVTECNAVELILSRDVRGAEADMWTVAAKTVTEAAKMGLTMPERDHGVWYVVLQTTDMKAAMEAVFELNRKASNHHAYALGTPTGGKI